jgi:membrane protease YdiL (CAAX protease family)
LSSQAFAVAVAGTIPMLIVFSMTYRISTGPLADVKRFLIESLGPFLDDCRWYDLAWVAFLAGVSEELLFRAVLQQWLNQWGQIPSLLISNFLFGAAHSVTAIYPLMAGLLGIYLGVLYQFAGAGNMLIPTITHGLYDFIAFLIVRRTYRMQQAENAESDAIECSVDEQ